MKFERRAPVRIGDLSNIHTLVTDDGIPEAAIELCRQQEVKLEIAAQAPPNRQSTGTR
jgi:DeoR/GlpR family transcriptional regulator of sugar metabolism